MKRIIKIQDGPVAAAVAAAPFEIADVSVQARALVERARQEAQAIVAEALARSQAVCDEATHKGYAEGFARGLETGQGDGRRQAEQEIRQTLGAAAGRAAVLADQIVQEFSAAREELLQQAKSQLLELAVALARKVVGRVVAADAGAARENLAKVLELAGGAAEIVVKVNPGQLAELEQTCGELAKALNLGGRVRLLADERISAGGVKLLTRHGVIDATTETQLDNVAAALIGSHDRVRDGSQTRGPDARDT